MKPWKVPFLGYRSPACLPSPVSAVDEFQEAEFMLQALINEDGEEPVSRELTGTRDPVPKVAVALLGVCRPISRRFKKSVACPHVAMWGFETATQ